MLLWLALSSMVWTVSSLSSPARQLQSGAFEAEFVIPDGCQDGEWTAVLQFDEDVSSVEVVVVTMWLLHRVVLCA